MGEFSAKDEVLKLERLQSFKKMAFDLTEETGKERFGYVYSKAFDLISAVVADGLDSLKVQNAINGLDSCLKSVVDKDPMRYDPLTSLMYWFVNDVKAVIQSMRNAVSQPGRSAAFSEHRVARPLHTGLSHDRAPQQLRAAEPPPRVISSRVVLYRSSQYAHQRSLLAMNASSVQRASVMPAVLTSMPGKQAVKAAAEAPSNEQQPESSPAVPATLSIPTIPQQEHTNTLPTESDEYSLLQKKKRGRPRKLPAWKQAVKAATPSKEQQSESEDATQPASLPIPTIRQQAMMATAAASMRDAEQDAAEDAAASAAEKVTCEACGRLFMSAHGLFIHTRRMHVSRIAGKSTKRRVQRSEHTNTLPTESDEYSLPQKKKRGRPRKLPAW